MDKEYIQLKKKKLLKKKKGFKNALDDTEISMVFRQVNKEY